MSIVYNLLMRKTVVLAILDGWGIGEKSNNNPIHLVNPPNINYIKQNYLAGALQASGISVGLPWGEEGNSEVGHATIGAGKVIYQHYPKISIAIKDGSFFKNEILEKAFAHAESNNSSVNLVGLLTTGSVHASYDHLEALLEFAKIKNVQNLKLHLITDGRDGPPKSAASMAQKLAELLEKLGVGKIASVSGRYYGMDRDTHYDRTKKCYDAILGKPVSSNSPAQWIEKDYQKELGDEFIEPTCFSDNLALKDNDSLIFFNYREDGIKQLAESFAGANFNSFPRAPLQNIYFASFTEYSKKIDTAVAFKKDEVEKPLGKILEENNKIQLRIAETEKYAHITFFFNGLKEEAFKNEYRILIPSKNIARHDEHPEMMAQEITARVVQAVGDGGSDFILVNFANPDIIAHTGNLNAAMEAVKVIDGEIKKIYDTCIANDAVLIITGDHGNIERMVNPLTGEIETKHDPNPVPIYIAGKDFVNQKSQEDTNKGEHEISGLLADVAPTILDIMGITPPREMTGVSLLKSLK